MISREELRELAEVTSPQGCAISFYYQPEVPQNVSHRSEVILVKDLVKDSLRRLARSGQNGEVTEVLQRIQKISEQFNGNRSRAKAIFACPENELWREYDLPPQLERTQLIVNSKFHLKPLAEATLSGSCWVALIDREKARLFDLNNGEITEREVIVDDVPPQVRSDGFGGYNAGHVERYIDNQVMQHYKNIADRLQEISARGQMDMLIIGCHAQAWADIEQHLHTYLKNKLIGHFVVDPGLASPEEVRLRAEDILEEVRGSEQQGLVREAIGSAQRNGRGATGLRRVMIALERGEVQALILGHNFAARGMECPNCGHLDTRMVPQCAVCGNENREVENMADALVGLGLRNSAELVFVKDDPDLERVGNVAAVLRFRADQNTAEKMAG